MSTLRPLLPFCLALCAIAFACSSEQAMPPVVSDGGSPALGSGGSGEHGSGGAGTGVGGESSLGGGEPTGSTGGAALGGSSSEVGGRSGAGGGESAGGAPPGTGGSGTDSRGWRLVWADEFDGPEIDSAHWEHEVDCWGGGNNELQCYVAEPKNSFVENGTLHLKVIKDGPSGPEGGGSGNTGVVQRDYSSARLRTKGKADFKYGRVVASLRLPSGQGIWPAFWMLPTDNVYGGWALSGEIDIMEAVNLDPDRTIHGTIHFGGAWPDNQNSGGSTVPGWKAWEEFHEYAVEWEEGEIRWYADNQLYSTKTEWNSAAAPFPAPFDQEFHLILNVAVGGNWPGAPNAQTTFPTEMLVDYVRVYECARDPEAGRGCAD